MGKRSSKSGLSVLKRALSALLALCLLGVPAFSHAEPWENFSYSYPEADSAGADFSVPYDPLLEESPVAPEDRHTQGLPEGGFSLFGVSLQMVPASYSYPRVLLSVPSVSTDVVFSGNYCLYSEDGTAVLIPESGAVYTLSYADGMVALSYAGAVLYRGEQFYFAEHTPPGGQAYNYFTLFNTAYDTNLSYTGSLAAYAALGSTPGLYLVNRVYIEDYLCGVVPGEIGENYGAAALQAQAVAARNYAYHKVTSSRYYDLLDTSENQVYKGILSAPNSAAAVAETAGKLLTYGGKVIEVFYSASNGGVTEIPSHRWTETTSIPEYIEIITDPYDLAYGQNYYLVAPGNPYAYAEEILVSQNGLDAKGLLKGMIKTFYSLTDEEANTIALTSVTLSAVNAHESFRADYENSKKGSATEFCSHFSSLTATCTGTYQKGGQSYAMTAQDIPVAASELCKKDGANYGFTNTRLSAFWLVDNGDNTYTVRHGRFGHGIGLSQIGAREMAARGFSVTDILTFYYPHTVLAVGGVFTGRETLSALPALTSEMRAVVYDSFVYMRANTASLIMGVAKAGSAIAVTGEKDGFCAVLFNGKTGYVKASAFTPVYGSITVVNVTASCNVRSEPSSAQGNKTIIGQAPLNASYPLLDKEAAPGWYKINYGGTDAYIFSAYARLDISAGETIGTYQITVTPPDGYADAVLWVDGVEYAAARSGNALTAQVYDTNAKTVVMYKLKASGTPQEMYAWTLSCADGIYTATPMPAAMQNLLTYHGCAIRITGKTGLRFISGIGQTLRAQLVTGAGVEGFRLLEYGTVVINYNSIGVYPFTKEGVAVKYGRSYWGTNNDFFIKIEGGRIQFASVLVDIPVQNYDWNYGFRAYAIVEKDGVSYTLYGGQVAPRSLYSVAKQVLAAGEFAEGTSAYNFVNNIVVAVEGK